MGWGRVLPSSPLASQKVLGLACKADPEAGLLSGHQFFRLPRNATLATEHLLLVLADGKKSVKKDKS
jgi:hypothetical protein